MLRWFVALAWNGIGLGMALLVLRLVVRSGGWPAHVDTLTLAGFGVLLLAAGALILGLPDEFRGYLTTHVRRLSPGSRLERFPLKLLGGMFTAVGLFVMLLAIGD